MKLSGLRASLNVAARRLAFVTFDPEWPRTLEALNREVVAQRAPVTAEELLGPDVPDLDLPPLDRTTLENRRLVLARHPELAGMARAWCRKSGAAPPASIEASDPQAMVRTLDDAGLLDFDQLDLAKLPVLYARVGAWPSGMPLASDLTRLGLVPDDLQREANHPPKPVRPIVTSQDYIDAGLSVSSFCSSGRGHSYIVDLVALVAERGPETIVDFEFKQSLTCPECGAAGGGLEIKSL